MNQYSHYAFNFTIEKLLKERKTQNKEMLIFHS